MSTPAATGPSSPAPGTGPAAFLTRLPLARPGRLGADATMTVALGLLLAAVALAAGGGLQLGPVTRVEVGLQLGGGILGALAVLDGARSGRRPLHGGAALGLFAAFTALTALSIVWAVQPADAWLEANRTLAYLGAFGGGIALARLSPDRWAGVLGAVLLACTLVSLYALASKVFPAALSPDETYARLREPFGYWNSVGLMAALGVPVCLWLGARRTGFAALNALAYPVLGLLLVTILLSYSRGSLLAAGVGCAAWFAWVPLRLRGVTVLGTSAFGAVLVAFWAFPKDGLSEDKVLLDDRVVAGHELGVALVAMVVVLGIAGLLVGFLAARRAPRTATRRRLGLAVVCVLGLVPVGLAVTLAFSERGLGGSVSNGVKELFDPNAKSARNEPGRLTAVGNARARYFNEALKIGKARPLLGAGAGGYATVRPRFRRDNLDVRHAHGYIVQTWSDLGTVGIVLTLALLVAWWSAAARSTGLRRRWRRLPFGPERIGLLTLLTVVLVFGVHSFVDWTWFVPGNAVLALFCAGWLAGRGPQQDTRALAEPPGPLRARLRGARERRPALAGAAACVLVALGCAWATVQPLRAVNAGDHALELADGGDYAGARAATEKAADLNPLSVEPLFDMAVIDARDGRPAEGRAALERAIRLQPQNPTTWLRLAEYELYSEANPTRAVQVLGPALYLDPRSTTGLTLYLEAAGQAAAAP